MDNLLLVLIVITVAFFILLGLKELFKKIKREFCVICVAVFFTWIILLTLYKFGLFEDIIIISILIGETVLGIFYLLESKVNDRLKIFRLPALLTLISAAYFLLINNNNILNPFIFLSILWIAFIFLYLHKNNSKIRGIIEKLIECCKWK